MQSARLFSMMRLVILVGISFSMLISHGLHASNMHAPMLCEQGPIRYLFDFDEPASSHHLKLWSSTYYRYASSAYTDVMGTKTDELSRLFFNESNFKLTEAFPNCLVSQNSEFYNPLIRTYRLHAKVDYNEKTAVFGGRYAVPVYKDVGRMGVRFSLPIKAVQIRRIDADGVPRGAELQEVMAISGQILPSSTGVSTTASRVPMIRLDFAEALVQSRTNNAALTFGDANNKPKIGGQEISDAIWTEGASAVDSSIRRCAGIVRSPAGFVPRPPDVKNTAIVSSATIDGTDAVLPADGNAEYKIIYRLETVGNPAKYSGLADETTNDIDERRARQHRKEELWLVPRVDAADANKSSFGEGGVLKTLTDLSAQVTENAYEWLEDRGHVLETASYSGFGDCAIDFFYEHALTDKCYGELSLGISIPTAQDNNDDYSSPYHAYLGNSKHWEVRLGSSLAAQPFSRLNLKINGYYAFVLPHEEMRHATFHGARVKGFGPLVPAFVNWNYGVARLEATIFHAKAHAISNTIGYELFYKERDSLAFPANNLSTWLGRTFAPDGTVLRNEFPLDPDLATKNTNMIAHRCKFETSFRVTKQCEFSIALGYTALGKNAPKAIDGSFSLSVSF